MGVLRAVTLPKTIPMKNWYLALAVVGFVLPNYFVLLESIETGNILLYADPIHTFSSMFANRIASIFAIDLLFAVVVFFVWSHYEARAAGVKKVWRVWLATMLLGLAGGFPLFLWMREKARKTE